MHAHNISSVIILYIFFMLCLFNLFKSNNGVEDLTEGLFQSNTCFSDVLKHVVAYGIVLVVLDNIIYTVDVTTYYYFDINMVRAYLHHIYNLRTQQIIHSDLSVLESITSQCSD